MFDLEEYLPYLLHQAHLSVLRTFEAGLSPSGLSLSEWRVLAALAHHKCIRFGQLAKITGQEPPTLVRLLSSMEDSGLVNRKPSVTDRRATDVELTERGQSLATSIIPLARHSADKALSDFTQDEAEFLRHLLRRIKNNVDRME